MFEVVEKLAAEKGLTFYQIAKATGLRPTLFYEWKAGRYTPKADKRQKIADFLGVSLEYLDTGEDPRYEGYDPEVLKIAQEMKENGILASAMTGLSAEDMQRVADFALALKSTYRET